MGKCVKARVCCTARASTDVDAVVALVVEKHSRNLPSTPIESVIDSIVTARRLKTSRSGQRCCCEFLIDGPPEIVAVVIKEISGIFPERCVPGKDTSGYDDLETDDMFNPEN